MSLRYQLINSHKSKHICHNHSYTVQRYQTQCKSTPIQKAKLHWMSHIMGQPLCKVSRKYHFTLFTLWANRCAKCHGNTISRFQFIR